MTPWATSTRRSTARSSIDSETLSAENARVTRVFSSRSKRIARATRPAAMSKANSSPGRIRRSAEASSCASSARCRSPALRPCSRKMSESDWPGITATIFQSGSVWPLAASAAMAASASAGSGGSSSAECGQGDAGRIAACGAGECRHDHADQHRQHHGGTAEDPVLAAPGYRGGGDVAKEGPGLVAQIES